MKEPRTHSYLARMGDTLLARKAGLSVDAFIRLFKTQTGFTPHAYVCLKRIEQACLVLHYSEGSIKEIAAMTGFCDRHHSLLCI